MRAFFELKLDELKRKFLSDKYFCSLMIFIVLVLIAIRSFPYILHGPFGFGYDTGIYKHVFENMTTFSGIFSSEIYILPAFFAYVFNFLHIPSSVLLYYFYILFSVLIAWPLYLLTKEFFGKIAGLAAVAIFTVSYVQVFASEYYLFKEMLGAIFLLFGFLYYVRKSKLFYVFLVLLGFTQLPQFLVLIAGTGVSAIVNWKKDSKFNLNGLLVLFFSFLFLVIFTPQHLVAAYRVVLGALGGLVGGFNPHESGSFIPLLEYFHREWFFFVLGIGGFIVAIKKKESFVLQGATIFLIVVVFFELFFERRYIIQMSLLLIIYAGYLFSVWYEAFAKEGKIARYTAIFILFIGIILGTVYHYRTTYPALNSEEQWALRVIIEKEDSEYAMVTSSYYAPWLYGFSGKKTLAPGIFISPWSSQIWMRYMEGSGVDQADLLIKIANEYGKIYVLEGTRQKYTRVDKASKLVNRIFDLNGVRIYEVSPSPSSSSSSSSSAE